MATTPTVQIPLVDPTNVGNEPGDGPLRAGGQPGTDVVLGQGDRPDVKSPPAQEQEQSEQLCRDCRAGNERIREAGLQYLPQHAGEQTSDYMVRLQRSVYHNFFGRAVEGMVGLIFQQDPVLGDDVPPQIVEDWENLDLAGTHGDVLLKELEEDAMTAGHAAILVDYPVAPEGATRADELELRPYWVPIRKGDIMSWRTSNRDGATVLEQVVLKRASWVPTGRFGQRLRTLYHVIWREQGEEGVRVPWELLEVSKQNVVVTVAEGEYRNQTEIPLAEVATSGRRSLFVSTPPLLDVAYLNLAHYQMWSDYATSIHKTCVPLLVLSGAETRDRDGNPRKIVVGPNTVLTLENPAARAAYESHNGAALDNVKEALEALKNDAGTLSLAMLAPQKRSAETAEAKRLDRTQSDSALSTTARALEDAVERALAFHAAYYQLDTGGSVEVNRDFEGLLLDAPLIQAYAALVDAGIPPRVVLTELQKGGRIPADEDIELLVAEMEANRMAAEEQRVTLEAERAARASVDIERDEAGRVLRLVRNGA